MFYVLKHSSTGEIYSCTMINQYDIPYFGAKSWDDADAAREQYRDFLQHNQEDPEQWELLEVEENRMKMFNVKLNNNPQRRIVLDADGRIIAKARNA